MAAALVPALAVEEVNTLGTVGEAVSTSLAPSMAPTGTFSDGEARDSLLELGLPGWGLLLEVFTFISVRKVHKIDLVQPLQSKTLTGRSRIGLDRSNPISSLP